ncbi:MAG: hypothetical protein JSW68_07130 [Burkholderiales bacterium]|nr:MAG: hypothetical protein JSW68_07130 [Burkholderiales bacterium]
MRISPARGTVSRTVHAIAGTVRRPRSGRQSAVRRIALACAMLILAAGCAPEYNWREIRAEPQGFRVMLPGKPATMTRRIDLDGMPVEMSMHGAKVRDTSFTVAMAGLSDASGATGARAMAAMRAAMTRNIQGRELASGMTQVELVDASGAARGIVPALWIEVAGMMRERPASMLARFSVLGDRAYQWVVLGYEIDREQALTFLDSLKLMQPAAR